MHCIVHSILCQSVKNDLLSEHLLSLKKHIASPPPSCFSKTADQCYLFKFIIDETTQILATDPVHIVKILGVSLFLQCFLIEPFRVF